MSETIKKFTDLSDVTNQIESFQTEPNRDEPSNIDENEKINDNITQNDKDELISISECIGLLNEDDELINDYIENNKETIFESPMKTTGNNYQYNEENDFYLRNFENAIKTVVNEKSFSCLLDESDTNTINKFFKLTSKIFSIFYFLSKNSKGIKK